MLKRLTPVVGAMLLTLATYAAAQELTADHPDTYTVKKGDTLWDISAKFFAKPWLWPEIWQANPQVKNPHRIYPGDVLSLHYVNGQPRVAMDGPEVHSGDAVDTVPLSEIEPWLKQLTIVNDPQAYPYVIGMAWPVNLLGYPFPSTRSWCRRTACAISEPSSGSTRAAPTIGCSEIPRSSSAVRLGRLYNRS